MAKIILTLLVICFIFACQNNNNKTTESKVEGSNTIKKTNEEKHYDYENEENQRLINFEDVLHSDLLKKIPHNWIELSNDENNNQVIYDDEWGGPETVKLYFEEKSASIFFGNDVGGNNMEIAQVEWQVDNDTIWLHGNEKYDGKTIGYTIAFCWIDESTGTASWTINDRFGLKKITCVTEEKQANFKTINTGSLPPENQ